MGVGTAVALWWPSAGAATAARATATVVKPASCGGADAHDQVEVKIGDEVKKAKLDGCGHREKETMDVVVPEDTSGEFMVQAAGSASEGVPLETRLTTLMLCLSGLAGGLYAFLVRQPMPRMRSPQPALTTP